MSISNKYKWSLLTIRVIQALIIIGMILIVFYTSTEVYDLVTGKEHPDQALSEPNVEPRHCQHLQMGDHWSYDMTICVSPRGWFYNNPGYLVIDGDRQDRIYQVIDSLRFEAIRAGFYEKEYDSMIYFRTEFYD